MKLFWGLLSLAILMGSSGASAQAACSFVARETIPSLFTALPESAEGLVSCPQFTDLNTLLSVRLRTFKTDEIEAAIVAVAKIVDTSGPRAEIIWRSNQPLTKRQILVRTFEPGSESPAMLHYAFILKGQDGLAHVLIHSMGEKQTKVLKSKLEKLNRAVRDSQVR